MPRYRQNSHICKGMSSGAGRRTQSGIKDHALALLAATAICSATQANAITLNNRIAADTAEVEDIFDRDNTLPNVVLAHGCTGTLINARTVLSAAHCWANAQGVLTPNPTELFVKFAPNPEEWPGGTPTPHDRPISGALIRENYLDNRTGNDMAIISLSQPVTGVTPVTLAGADELPPLPGTLAVITGYGQYGTGLDGGLYDGKNIALVAPDNGRRRIGMTRIGAYREWTWDSRSSAGYEMIEAQFRNPDSPDDPDVYGLDAAGFDVPDLQAGVGRGDSGGPLFLVREDGSLVQVGVLGLAMPDPATGTVGYGLIGGWEFVGNYLDWINANNPLRSVAALPGSGLWSDAGFWSEATVPDNVDGSFDPPLGQTGRYYDVWLSNASTVKVDISPTIDNLQITNPAAALDILPDRRLTVLLDTLLPAGRLHVDGVLDTGRLIQDGGIVSGRGTIVAPYGFTNVAGTVAPGADHRLGTLTVAGDYVQAAGGTLAVRVDATGSDRLAVEGRAALDGKLQLHPFRTAPAVGQAFTVVTAEAVEGGFTQVSATLPAFTWTRTVVSGQVIVTAGVDYTDDVPSGPAVDPEIRAGSTAAASSLNQAARRITPEEAREAAAISVIGGAPPAPETPALAIAGLNIMDTPSLGRTLEALPPAGFHGQSGAARQTAQLVSGVLTDRLNALGGGSPLQRGFTASSGGSVDAAGAPLANAVAAQARKNLPGDPDALAPSASVAPKTPFGIFVAGSLIRSGAGASSGYRTYGLTAGLDYRVSPDSTIGVALTYAEDLRTVDGMKHDGHAVVPTLYGRFGSGSLFVDGYLGYAFGTGDTQRLIAWGSQFLSARASPRYGQVLAGAQAGIKLDAATLSAGRLRPGALTLTPFVGLDATHAHFDSYHEQGAGALSSRLAARDLAELRATAGIEAAWNVPLSFGILTPRLKASVTQRFGDRTDHATVSFAAAPDLPFGLGGERGNRTYGSFGAAVALQSAEALSALVSYQADVTRDGVQDNRFSAKVSYRF